MVSEGLLPLLWPINLVLSYQKAETRTSPVLNAVFIPQIGVLDVELGRRLVKRHWYRTLVAEHTHRSTHRHSKCFNEYDKIESGHSWDGRRKCRAM